METYYTSPNTVYLSGCSAAEDEGAAGQGEGDEPARKLPRGRREGRIPFICLIFNILFC